MHKFIRNKYAVTSLIGSVLIIAIVMSSIGVVITVYKPQVDNMKDYYQLQSMNAQLNVVNDAFRDVINKGTDSSEKTTIDLNSGSFNLKDSDKENRLAVMTSNSDNFDYDIRGLDETIDNFEIKMNEGTVASAKIQLISGVSSYNPFSPQGVPPPTINEDEVGEVFITNDYDFTDIPYNSAYRTIHGTEVPLKPDLITAEYSEAQYGKIESDDTNRNVWIGESPPYNEYINLLYKFQIEEDPLSIDHVIFNWVGNDPLTNEGSFGFYLWNKDSSSWKWETIQQDRVERTTKETFEFNIQPSDFSVADFSSFIDTDGYMIFGVSGSKGPSDPVQSITVTNPTSDSEWHRDESVDIEWTSENIIGNVKIELYKLPAGPFTPITDETGTENDGFHQWNVLHSQTFGSYYLIITSVESPGVSGTSEVFQISDSSSSGDTTEDCAYVPCCFPAGTLISLSDGGFKCIEDVIVGDGVLSFDVEDENFVYSSVTNLIVKVREGVYSINDGLVCPTNDHPFYVMKADGRFGWAAINPDVSKVMYGDRDAMPLEVGDFLFSSDGSWIRINSIEFLPGVITTYTFTVDSICHDYFANNVLVSNADACVIVGTTECSTTEATCYSTCGTCTATCAPTCGVTCASCTCCFPVGTLISMSDGSFKNIEDVVVGDGVLSFDVDENVFVSSYVTELVKKLREGVYSINDGLVCPTNDHPFYVMKADGCFGWAAISPEESQVRYKNRDAMPLEVGDFLFNKNLGWIKINTIDYNPGNILTYTFAVDSVCHDYFANNILVSNKLGDDIACLSLPDDINNENSDDLLGIYDDKMLSFSNKIFSVIPDYDDSSSDSPIYISRAVSSLEGEEFEPEINYLGKTSSESISSSNVIFGFTIYEYYVNLEVHYIADDTTAPLTFISSTTPSYNDIITTGTPVSFTWEGIDDYTDPENLVYKYRLDPSDEYSSWTPDDWTSETSLDFGTDLSPGDYVFRVRAMDESLNIETIENTASNTLYFSIINPEIELDDASTFPISSTDSWVILDLGDTYDFSDYSLIHIELIDESDNVAGDIWIANYNPIYWKDSSSSGVFLENNAVFSSSQNKYFMDKKPDNNHKISGDSVDTIVLNIVQTDNDENSISSIGGYVKLNLDFKCKENIVLVDNKNVNLKMQTFGESKKPWDEYYIDLYGLEESGDDSNTLVPSVLSNDICLVLSRSVIELNMGYSE